MIRSFLLGGIGSEPKGWCELTTSEDGCYFEKIICTSKTTETWAIDNKQRLWAWTYMGTNGIHEDQTT